MYERIAIAGATGAVGRIVRQLLEQRQFPFSHIKFLASERSAGQKLTFRDQEYVVEELTPESVRDVDLVIASTPDDVAIKIAPWVTESGGVMIDESGAHRMLDHVPLVIPEVNPDAVHEHQGIIASPNCSTTQMVVALRPLHDAARVKRVIVSTYQATSGAGVGGDRDLKEGSKAALAGDDHQCETFAHPIAFNLIPQIGSGKEDDYTSEELKMVRETHKILGDDSIRISPTCVRVPVTNCHSESIWVETEEPLSAEAARELFRQAAGITVVDNLGDASYPMPLDCSDSDDVFVGRIRRDISCDNGLTFWCVSDNLRKGAATNAVQIAELLIGRRAPSCVPSS